MNIGSFVTHEKETYGIFFDDCAQSVTDDFIREYRSLREVIERKSIPLMYENALGTPRLKYNKIKFLPPIGSRIQYMLVKTFLVLGLGGHG